MNIDVKNKTFLILGASSGFGRHIATQIALEGGHPILVARSVEKLQDFERSHPDSSFIAADLFSAKGLQKLNERICNRSIYGVLVNAGGPPAGSFPMKPEDWDRAYATVLRWKVELLRDLLPRLQEAGQGRIVFIESISVKEPVEGLILSNVFRMGVVGLMKSIVNELEGKDILLNMIAPGYHLTDRLENLIKKQSKEGGISTDQVAAQLADRTTLKKLGDPASLAQLATWLLSPGNTYITGQIFPVDGGMTRGI